MPPLLLVLLAALAAAAGQPLQPGQVYRVVESGSITFVAPSVALEAREALDIVSTPTLEACAAACRQLVDCTEFEYCAVPGGCKQAEPKELYMDCRLIASNCSVLPTVEAAGAWIQRVSGFVLRHTPIDLPDFTTSPAQVLGGGDFDCPGSILPGRCAFRSVNSAVSICSSMTRCRSVLYYHNGTDGCSEPVAVLSTSWPTETNSYVAPTVDVLTKKTDKMTTTMLMASDGVVLEPSQADLAAAANASDPSTAWLGCIVAEGALMDGSVVAVADGVATAEDCCRACRANSKCNVWNHCSQQGGCSFAASSPLLGQFTVNLTQGQCELRYQETVATGWPPIVLAKGADVPLTAGAPLAVAGQQLSGYVALPGRAAFDYGMFECAESAWPELKQCILVDQPAQLAAKCSSIPDCVAMVIKPVPGLPSSLHAGNLRNAFNTSELGLSPTDLMYVRESVLAAHSSGSSSGLSGGAVAGIAVGACAAAAALTGAAWLALRRRQRQRRPLGSMGGSSGPKGLEAGGSSGGSAANGSTQTCSALGTEGPASSHLGLASGGLTSPANPASNTCGPQAQPAAAARELPPAGPPCMRAAWDPSHTPSPFAAQATTPFDAPIMPPSPFVAQAATPIDAAATPPSPFAAQAATPIGSAVPATAAGSSVAVLEGINSRRYTSSRNAAVLSRGSMLSEDCCGPPPWGSAPREVLQLVFERCPLKDRCQTVGGVCTWWRQVSLEANLLPDLNLNCLPLFAQRTRSLPDFYPQRNSFIAWLLPRRNTIRRLSLTAERWEDDSQAVYLRMAVADLLAGNLEYLRLVCTDSGQTTSAFLRGGNRLRELQLDFWGRSNSLPRAMADCAQLTKLSVQCSSGLEHYKPLGALRSLKDLSVVDCDWPRIPDELLQLGLTRLHLRFADFADGRWFPKDAGRLAGSLRVLELPGCQISALPEELSQLAGLTRLYLERNYVRELPASLARLQGLEELSCEGCASLRELPACLAAALPLRSLNLLQTGVLRLPAAYGVRLAVGSGMGLSSSEAADEVSMEDAPATPGSSSRSGGEASEAASVAAAAAASSYLRHLTELRWGVAEWDSPGASGGPPPRRWVSANGAVAAGGAPLPDLSPLLQAGSLRTLQLAHVPATAEAQLAALVPHLPLLRTLQVNSAVLLG